MHLNRNDSVMVPRKIIRQKWTIARMGAALIARIATITTLNLITLLRVRPARRILPQRMYLVMVSSILKIILNYHRWVVCQLLFVQIWIIYWFVFAGIPAGFPTRVLVLHQNAQLRVPVWGILLWCCVPAFGLAKAQSNVHAVSIFYRFGENILWAYIMFFFFMQSSGSDFLL